MRRVHGESETWLAESGEQSREKVRAGPAAACHPTLSGRPTAGMLRSHAHVSRSSLPETQQSRALYPSRVEFASPSTSQRALSLPWLWLGLWLWLCPHVQSSQRSRYREITYCLLGRRRLFACGAVPCGSPLSWRPRSLWREDEARVGKLI
jgi:hypothetical protein